MKSGMKIVCIECKAKKVSVIEMFQLYYKRETAVALHVQSTGSRLLFFSHAMSSPTNQVEEQEYFHLGGRSTLEE